MDDAGVETALNLMEKYIDRPMDLADASLVVAAQCLKTNRVFTTDRNDFFVYRIETGHHLKNFDQVARQTSSFRAGRIARVAKPPYVRSN